MKFRREELPSPSLCQGASFRRSRGSQVIETAKIIAVTSDPAGIPHVRFNLRIAGLSEVAEEERTLALDWFKTLYREPISA